MQTQPSSVYLALQHRQHVSWIAQAGVKASSSASLRILTELLLLRLATDEYREYFERDAALARRFQPVVVEAPLPALARQMLEVLTHL